MQWRISHNKILTKALLNLNSWQLCAPIVKLSESKVMPHVHMHAKQSLQSHECDTMHTGSGAQDRSDTAWYKGRAVA
jgi:hypothetical protein